MKKILINDTVWLYCFMHFRAVSNEWKSQESTVMKAEIGFHRMLRTN